MTKSVQRVRSFLGRASLLSLLMLSASSLGCKQGEGDVCQVSADCEDGLVCIASTGTCEAPGSSSTADAEVVSIDANNDPIDAEVPDAEVPDAEVPDAEVPDANPGT